MTPAVVGRPRLVLAGLLLGVLVLTGCGAADPVAESPFATRLAQIDRSLAARHFVQARSDLSSLAAETRAARDAGDLGRASAEAILRAIAGLKATLPAATPTPTPTATPTVTPTATPGPVTAPAGTASEKPAKGPGKPGGKGKGNK